MAVLNVQWLWQEVQQEDSGSLPGTEPVLASRRYLGAVTVGRRVTQKVGLLLRLHVPVSTLFLLRLHTTGRQTRQFPKGVS